MNISSIPDKINESKDRTLRPFIEKRWPRWFTPNKLNLLRVGIGLIIIPMLFDYETWRRCIIILFSLGLLTDFLDGTIARTFGMVSKTGGIFDPLADKILVIPLFIFLLKDPAPTLLAFLLIFALSLAVVGPLALALGRKGSANNYGKWKTVFEAVGILVLLVFGASFWGFAILWLAALLAIGSLVGHLKALCVSA